MLKSEKNKHAEKNATTSKFGQLLPIKNGTGLSLEVFKY